MLDDRKAAGVQSSCGYAAIGTLNLLSKWQPAVSNFDYHHNFTT